jgi:hypothetical protein
MPFCAMPNFTLARSIASCPTPLASGMATNAHTQALPTLTHLGPICGTLRYAESASAPDARATSAFSLPAHSQASALRMSAFSSCKSRLGSGCQCDPRSTGLARGLSTRGNQRSTDLSKAGRPIFSSTAWASPDHFWPGFAPPALVQCYRSATQAARPSPSIASTSRIAASDHVSPGTSGSSEVESPQALSVSLPSGASLLCCGLLRNIK